MEEVCSDREKIFIKIKTARLALQIYHVVDLLDRKWQQVAFGVLKVVKTEL